MLALLLVDPLQLALDRSRAPEQASIQLVEARVGRVKHEAARHADCDADRAAVELDCKSLSNHDDSTPGEAGRALLRGVCARELS
jgi:hypothetical protein